MTSLGTTSIPAIPDSRIARDPNILTKTGELGYEGPDIAALPKVLARLAGAAALP